MNNSAPEIPQIVKDILTWCVQHLFKILSMPLQVILYVRIGERQLTGNLLPYLAGIGLLIFVGFQEGSVLYPGWYPNLPFVFCLVLLSLGLWLFQYWQIQYFHTLDPKKVWHTKSTGVPRFFYESGAIPQRWTQPLLILTIGCLYFVFTESTAILLYFTAAAFGLWADYAIMIGKQHELYLDEIDAGLSSGEIIDGSLEVIPQKNEPVQTETEPPLVSLDNRHAFRESLKRAQSLFGYVPGTRPNQPAETTSNANQS